MGATLNVTVLATSLLCLRVAVPNACALGSQSGDVFAPCVGSGRERLEGSVLPPTIVFPLLVSRMFIEKYVPAGLVLRALAYSGHIQRIH